MKQIKDIEEIDCEFTEEIVCPYCGDEWTDSWEYDSSTFGERRLDDCLCDECENVFEVSRNVTVTYSTARVLTCKDCARWDESRDVCDLTSDDKGENDKACSEISKK
jgi:hypothetical protein